MVLEFHQKFSGKFEGYFFKEFKFKSTRVPQIKYSKRDRSLNIFQNNDKLIYISVNSSVWPFWLYIRQSNEKHFGGRWANNA